MFLIIIVIIIVSAAKEYFVDLNDITEWAIKKNGAVTNAAYQKSLVDLAAFRAAL